MAAQIQEAQIHQTHPFAPRKSIKRRRCDSCAAPTNNHTAFSVRLPDDILEYIFTFLPVKEAVKAGLVSTRFKNSWTLNRKLFFDRGLGRADCKAISIINHVVNSHAGSEIKAFRLSFDPTGIEPTVLNWIEKFIHKGIEELELEFVRTRWPFMFPHGFLESLDRIKIMKLTHCQISFPSLSNPNGKNHLRFLNSIFLKRVNVGGELIENLVSNCSFLESLELVQCKQIRQLRIPARNNKFFKVLKVRNCSDISEVEIDAPTLCTFHYYGNLRSFFFEEYTNLQLNDVVFVFHPSKSFPLFKQVEVLVNNVKFVKFLTITSSFLEGLSTRNIQYGTFYSYTCFSLSNLTELQLFLDGTSFCNLYDIASFLNSCPRLKRLFIDLNEFYSECGHYWEYHQKEMLIQYQQIFTCLDMIKIRGFRFQRHEMEMMRFFLEKSVCLDTLYLVLPKNGRISIFPTDLPTCQYLFLAWKASPYAKISIYEYQNDKSPFPKHSNL